MNLISHPIFNFKVAGKAVRGTKRTTRFACRVLSEPRVQNGESKETHHGI